jgi:hypothetical protein
MARGTPVQKLRQYLSSVPEYRGLEYVLVGDSILIVDPVTLEIIAVIPA